MSTNKSYNGRLLKSMIKNGRIATQERIFKGKKYQMIICGGKYLNIGVCLDSNETNEKEKRSKDDQECS